MHLDLKVVLPERGLGLCGGVERGFKVLFEAFRYAQTTNGVVTYRYSPPATRPFIQQLTAAGYPLVSWEEGIKCGPKVAYISPYGAPVDSHEGLKIFDGTCPRVQSIYDQAKKFTEQDRNVIIIGMRDEFEPMTILDHCAGKGTIVQSVADLEAIATTKLKRFGVVEQSSFRPDSAIILNNSISCWARENDVDLIWKDTLCPEYSHRLNTAFELARTCDYVLIIGSADSSFGNYAAATLTLVRNRSDAWRFRKCIRIENADEIGAELFMGDHLQIGLVSTISTPMEMVASIKQKIESLTTDDNAKSSHPTYPCLACPDKVQGECNRIFPDCQKCSCH